MVINSTTTVIPVEPQTEEIHESTAENHTLNANSTHEVAENTTIVPTASAPTTAEHTTHLEEGEHETTTEHATTAHTTHHDASTAKPTEHHNPTEHKKPSSNHHIPNTAHTSKPSKGHTGASQSNTGHDSTVVTEAKNKPEAYSWWKIVVTLVVFCAMAGIIMCVLRICEKCIERKNRGSEEDLSGIEDSSNSSTEKISTSRV